MENELQSFQVEKENVVNECECAEHTLLQPIGNIAISLIRTVENAREIDACAGMSTKYGYLTTRPVMLKLSSIVNEADTPGTVQRFL